MGKDNSIGKVIFKNYESRKLLLQRIREVIKSDHECPKVTIEYKPWPTKGTSK
jgi:hypothetical protein